MIPIKITKKASEEILNIIKNKGIPEGYNLRVGVKGGGGCGGPTFILGFDKMKETDEAFEFEGVSVIYEKRQMMFLLGKVVDFHDGDESRGFYFRDENSNS